MSIPSAISLIHGSGPTLYVVAIEDGPSMYARASTAEAAQKTLHTAEGVAFSAMLDVKAVDPKAEVIV